MEELSFGKMKSKAKTLLYYYIHKRNGQPFDKEKMEELLAFYEISEEKLEYLIVLAIEKGSSRSDIHRNILEESLSNEIDKIFTKGSEEDKMFILIILMVIAFCSHIASGELKFEPIHLEKIEDPEL